MKKKYRHLGLSLLSIYLIVSGYAVYNLLRNLSQTAEALPKENPGHNGKVAEPLAEREKTWDFSLDEAHDPPDTEEDVQYTVEVWGKAAIGNYLWEHIMDAAIIPKMEGVWSYGSLHVRDLMFRYRTGPGVIPEKVPQETEHLVLVLNGRAAEKIEFARDWLDYLPNYPRLQNVAVVLLGNEECNNDWIKPYLTVNGGLVKFVFLVYDSPDVDDVTFYQWPLGVATYREFPKVDPASINTLKPRYFRCNFLGTIYPNSTRQTLLKVLQQPPYSDNCYIKPRQQWWAAETLESQYDYMHALLQSDLTLSPVGKNAECYRTYEAISYGSVPVIEDIVSPGRCSNTAHRLLKQYKAPVVFIEEWAQLASIMEKELTMPKDVIIRRRQNILEWYIYFKRKMKQKFVAVVRERFFAR